MSIMDYTKESVMQTIKCYPTNRREKLALDILKSFKKLRGEALGGNMSETSRFQTMVIAN